MTTNHQILLRLFLGILLVALHFHPSQGACPTTCVCKWKNGKRTVECKGHNLSVLPEGIDPETQVLDLSNNNFLVLPAQAFQRAGLADLQKIHLKGNGLSQIDPAAFSRLFNLVEIDLSDNRLTDIPSAALKHSPNLRELYLAGNPITSIKSGAFQGLSSLVKLDLSQCRITAVDDHAFAHLPSLETLKIHTNLLKTFSSTAVESLTSLKGIELHNNPWDCDCRIRDLKVWLERRNVPHPVSPECRAPARLEDRKFSDLSINDFACMPKLVKANQVVRWEEGQNATLECRFDASPVTSVKWYSIGRLIVNNTLINAQRKFVIFEDEDRSRLVLTNALEKDSGDFYCVVENPAGFDEANFTLEILPAAPPLEAVSVALIVLGFFGIFLIIVGGLIFAICRHRKKQSKSSEVLATSTPSKPPRLNYDINSGSLVSNGFKSKIDTTDNPDLILETNNSGTYQETAMEDHSSNSELNWEQQSYRNMGYSTEYPPDYGLPIIHENSVYSENSYYVSPTNGSVVMSGLFNKNKVGARITAPSARDSPDEGYQEGYCGTDV